MHLTNFIQFFLQNKYILYAEKHKKSHREGDFLL